MMASVRTLGSRRHILRELTYTLILSAIALGSTGWMAAPDGSGLYPQIAAIFRP
ncbi:hypothetical protein [Microvirga pudoricolor]|uniref:hypothetical protein n=1 Tax=Microvirga pudoricolor TaxID=2778729 RepID=UPI001950AF2B|nr:hypothetical protein [Microvirga pudoricolor]MBM6592745.1 hypothetical protein [Microvirga pudoricolor]